MKRDFSEVLLDLDGEPLKHDLTPQDVLKAINAVEMPADVKVRIAEAIAKAEGDPITLKSVCVSALTGAYQDETGISDEERIARMALAEKVHKGGVVEIEAIERDKMKPLIKKRFNGVVVPVLAWRLLEKDAKE